MFVFIVMFVVIVIVCGVKQRVAYFHIIPFNFINFIVRIVIIVVVGGSYGPIKSVTPVFIRS